RPVAAPVFRPGTPPAAATPPDSCPARSRPSPAHAARPAEPARPIAEPPSARPPRWQTSNRVRLEHRTRTCLHYGRETFAKGENPGTGLLVGWLAGSVPLDLRGGCAASGGWGWKNQIP